LGTSGGDFFAVNFWLDAGSEFNARTNSLGQQSGTFDIAQVQLEAGTVATPFEHRSFGQELALCMRYYEKSFNQATAPANGPNGTSFATGSNAVSVFSQGNIGNTSYRFMVPKRASPTITLYGNSTGQVAVANTNAGVGWTTVAGNINAGGNEIGITAYNSTSVFQHLTFAFAASAEL
jgi:hypothetical protein